MITGCNTNIRHREMVFHVQTEDSGRSNPHIISHVYYGGTIVASHKQDYSDAVDSPDLAAEVRSRIEEQHKTMLKALRRGEFDSAIVERLVDRPGNGTQPDFDDSESPASSDSGQSADTAAGQSGGTTGNATTGGLTPANVTAPETAPQTLPPAPGQTKPQIDTNPRVSDEGPAPTEKVAQPSAGAAFGESVDTQKPLDEVILEYLVEKARERSSDRRPPPKTRSNE